MEDIEPPLRDPLDPKKYYDGLKGAHGSLQDKFNDIDEKGHFETYMLRLKKPNTQNFVLDFGNEDAYCATDLVTKDFKALLNPNQPRSKCFGTRWIHLWAPEEQTDAIKGIMSFYGVSERLQGLMCTAPVIRPSAGNAEPKKRRSRTHDLNMDRESDDVENAFAMKNLRDTEDLHDTSSFKHLTFSQVTDQIWHFSSVDHGPRYTCIGYNTLFVTPGVPKEKNENGIDLPEGKRLWNWLVLCDDGTIISMQENPFPHQKGPLDPDQLKMMDIVRRNVRFIVSGVSKQHLNMSESDSLVTIRVRHFHEVGPDQANIKQEDGPSLLYYYIFDDWVSSYGLIAKREHQYGVALERLRRQMLDRPIVDLVNELHWLGRRLAVLKRLYQSYELIMRRVLQRQRLLRDEARSTHPPPLAFGATFGDIEFADMRQGSLVSYGSLSDRKDRPVGVILSSAAVARFERLVDRINLYCLSEIESCLLEKESLTFLNFNLIALKDSQAVEKLTRITILLAKATMLFLPVSLMTAYFSTELQGVKGGYTKADYWVSFAVIFFVTLILLTVFGFASDTVEGKTIYRSLVKSFFRSSRERISMPRRKQQDDD
ncbi:hypothetical protein N7466_005411 [Penicillium verhagenii]|uniref:uncharacterized protein n=1 Tax=Penicillium verhagenii TaxID=1562060 RepID=UPI0025456545|nr:uncharacterized protein N7466_005411 [Penicillium verhagenii]KAJ5929918.1 hypothetical protein N7466_005411 [Penicillium verhagenii]